MALLQTVPGTLRALTRRDAAAHGRHSQSDVCPSRLKRFVPEEPGGSSH